MIISDDYIEKLSHMIIKAENYEKRSVISKSLNGIEDIFACLRSLDVKEVVLSRKSYDVIRRVYNYLYGRDVEFIFEVVIKVEE